MRLLTSIRLLSYLAFPVGQLGNVEHTLHDHTQAAWRTRVASAVLRSLTVRRGGPFFGACGLPKIEIHVKNRMWFVRHQYRVCERSPSRIDMSASQIPTSCFGHALYCGCGWARGALVRWDRIVFVPAGVPILVLPEPFQCGYRKDSVSGVRKEGLPQLL